ncbi:hypothetical protein AVEN_230608-1 [Araneus ventricosus]|uniref:HTH CENPB-type domain-containing protein n=1 Tax=Araneus ventricosus TaxID=182803 RepID=A0A4Y2A1E9_ARAVE|nr:hypothetical protein AVEN_230608-1 [Araneus ventricosus]
MQTKHWTVLRKSNAVILDNESEEGDAPAPTDMVDKQLECEDIELDCNLPIGGNEVKEKAEQFAQKLGYKDFKSSNGWLKIFKNRHKIVFRKLCAESVSDELCSEWIKTLPDLLQEYLVLMRLGFSSKHC